VIALAAYDGHVLLQGIYNFGISMFRKVMRDGNFAAYWRVLCARSDHHKREH